MPLLDEILDSNRQFVEERERPMTRDPAKKIAIFTCMDTRLVDFLEPAMGLKRGDAKVIKNAGNTIIDPFGGVVRSLVVAIYVLGCQEIYVIGHRDCGMSQLNEDLLEQQMLERGVPAEVLANLHVSLHEWVGAFHDPHRNVINVVNGLRVNPLIPKDVPVHGLMFDPSNGKLHLLSNGYGPSGDGQ